MSTGSSSWFGAHDFMTPTAFHLLPGIQEGRAIAHSSRETPIHAENPVYACREDALTGTRLGATAVHSTPNSVSCQYST